MLAQNRNRTNQSNRSLRNDEYLPITCQDMADIIYERRRRKKFSLFNLINPWWVISSLTCAIFRLLGFRKSRPLPHELDYLSNALPDDHIIVKYPLRYSMQSIIPTLEDSMLNRDSKCTQTELENYFHDKFSSQIGDLVRLRRFRNILKPCRKRVRKIMSRKSNNFLKALNSRNCDRYGGRITKARRNRNDCLARTLRMIQSNTSTVDVDNAMEDAFYVSDSEG